jgi:hypothetical protein
MLTPVEGTNILTSDDRCKHELLNVGSATCKLDYTTIDLFDPYVTILHLVRATDLAMGPDTVDKDADVQCVRRGSHFVTTVNLDSHGVSQTIGRLNVFTQSIMASWGLQVLEGRRLLRVLVLLCDLVIDENRDRDARALSNDRHLL